MTINQKRTENLIYVSLWLVVLTVPVFTLQGGEAFRWGRVFFEWIRLLPLFVIFLLNNSLLAPQLLLRKKILPYLVYISIATLLVTYFSTFTQLMQDYFVQPPPPGRRPPPRPGSVMLINRILLSLLVVGFNDGIKLLIQGQQEEQERKEQEKIHLQTELSFLRQQISPHFFMNTLNNIHALIDIEKEQAQAAVIQLSKLMRYLLTGSQQKTTTLKEEFEFLQAYIDLMKLRVSDKVNITVSLEVTEPDRQIPPLLFISPVENAFKHGVSYHQSSFISIQASIIENKLYFSVMNSKSPEQTKAPGTGLGLENLRKQLQLLYGNHYLLDIVDEEAEFTVNLEIPLHHD